MREYRKSKLALSAEESWKILESPETIVGYLGTHGIKSESEYPYVVPLNFAADNKESAIYIHTTLDADSKKNLSVAENPNVSFTVVHPASKVLASEDGLACKFSMSFASVMTFGIIHKIDDAPEKARVLNLIMKQKSGVDNFIEVSEHVVGITNIYRIDVKHITGSRKN